MKVTELKKNPQIIEWLQTANVKRILKSHIFMVCRTLPNTQGKSLAEEYIRILNKEE